MVNDIPPEATDPNKKPPYISDKWFLALRQLVQVGLPATGTLYFSFAHIWGLPEPENVVGSIAALTTFLGVCLGISTKNYREAGDYLDGAMVVQETPNGKKVFLLQLHDDPEPLEHKDAVIFAVKKEDTPPVE